MHASATMIDVLRGGPPHGLCCGPTARLPHEALAGVYGAEPPVHGFRHDHPQGEIDALPRRLLAGRRDKLPARPAIEGYTVMFDRDGTPQQAITACLLADGRRAWATSTDGDTAVALAGGEWVGRAVRIDKDPGGLHVLNHPCTRRGTPSARRARL